MTTIKNTLGDKLIPRCPLTELTLHNVLKKKQQCVVFYQPKAEDQIEGDLHKISSISLNISRPRLVRERRNPIAVVADKPTVQHANISAGFHHEMAGQAAIVLC